MDGSSRKKRTWFYLLNIIVPFYVGLMLWIIFRPESAFAVLVRRITGIPFPVVIGTSIAVRFIRSYAAEILWAYASVFAMHWISRKYGYGLLKSGIICSALILFTEMLQQPAVMPGTFDIFDIILETAAVFAGLYIIRRNQKE